MATPRQRFHDELARLEEAALGGLDLVVEQLDRVLEALEHQDVELAEIVIHDDDRLDGRYLEVHQGVLSLLALQAPGSSTPPPVVTEGSPGHGKGYTNGHFTGNFFGGG